MKRRRPYVAWSVWRGSTLYAVFEKKRDAVAFVGFQTGFRIKKGIVRPFEGTHTIPGMKA